RGKNYRFSVLTPRLIRLEYSKNGVFEDRATSLVVNRTFNDCVFSVSSDETTLYISTEYFSLTYIKESPLTSKTIRVKVNGTDKEWTRGHQDVRNCGSLSYSLDDLNDKFKLSNGLYSMSGYAEIDDSNNFVIDKDNFIKREGITDIYLFVYRTDLGLCLQDYFNLTGYPPMIPRYTLGSWWYKNDKYNMYEIDETLKKFHDNHIPISVFLLGDKWHNDVENYNYDRTLFDVNNIQKYYSNKLQKFGLTINPSLKITPNDPIYNELIKYIPQANNTISFIPLNNNSINLYLNLVVNNLMNSGINIFNIDYNNKSDKDNLFLLNHYHYVISNMNIRGVILSRNPRVAPHRYPIIYSGKTKVSWNTLRFLASYNNSASNLGVSWHTHAIGGYYGGIEDDELYLRYIQFGVFNPIFILASDAGKYYKREPWKWNQTILSVIREYMQLRNKLVPYIYNESYNYHKFGVPLIQPLYYKYPKIYDEPNYVNQYFFGSRIMISPITKRKNSEMNRVVQRIFIPNGIWYDYSTGKKFIGNKYYMNFYKNEDYPIFIKEGSIIPMSLDDNTDCPKNMEIQIFPAENGLYGSYELYEDDGISLNPGENYLITKMNLDKVENGYKFTITPKEGNMNIDSRNYLLRFRNMKSPQHVIVNYEGQIINNKYEIEKNDLIVKLENIHVYSKVEINIIGTNLEIETESVINEEIEGILYDLEINTILKYKIDGIIFSDIPIKKKRIALRKLKKDKLEPKYINMFIGLLDFIEIK
ncbi:MAG: DUF5110 domain-containing protein, partial [Bacilli bacterium]|nr:DUF5110 domain-containing protein [Bacilli bacterium]